jgi:hypothetical protein
MLDSPNNLNWRGSSYNKSFFLSEINAVIVANKKIKFKANNDNIALLKVKLNACRAINNNANIHHQQVAANTNMNKLASSRFTSDDPTSLTVWRLILITTSRINQSILSMISMIKFVDCLALEFSILIPLI